MAHGLYAVKSEYCPNSVPSYNYNACKAQCELFDLKMCTAYEVMSGYDINAGYYSFVGNDPAKYGQSDCNSEKNNLLWTKTECIPSPNRELKWIDITTSDISSQLKHNSVVTVSNDANGRLVVRAEVGTNGNCQVCKPTWNGDCNEVDSSFAIFLKIIWMKMQNG